MDRLGLLSSDICGAKGYILKLITWNVNGIRAVAEKGWREFVISQNPDILCIQETKAHRNQVDDLAHPANMRSYWSSAQKKGYSGVATFTKDPVQRAEFGLGKSQYDLEGRVLITQHPQFKLYNIYFPNGSQGAERHMYKMSFLNDLTAMLKIEVEHGVPVVVVGDYNVAYLESDVHDPGSLSGVSGFLPEERDWFKNFLGLGFVDAFRLKNPESKETYTWWSYRDLARQENRGWRIDHICVTQNLVDKIKNVEILNQQMGSDHCPVAIEFINQ